MVKYPGSLVLIPDRHGIMWGSLLDRWCRKALQSWPGSTYLDWFFTLATFALNVSLPYLAVSCSLGGAAKHCHILFPAGQGQRLHQTI